MKANRTSLVGFVLLAAALGNVNLADGQQSNTQLPAVRREVHTRNVQQMPTSRRQAATGDQYRVRVQPNAVPRRIVRPGFSNWRIGVNTADAPLGLRIENVVSWSPGYYAGLEAGDYILDVNGYPVGTYSGGYFPLQSAISALADADGWVELGIWNYRTKQEEYMWVQLERR